jgi:hypothetical protein
MSRRMVKLQGELTVLQDIGNEVDHAAALKKKGALIYVGWATFWITREIGLENPFK